MAIFRVRSYSHITYSVRWWWLLINEIRRKPTTGTRCPTHFDKGHGISVICPVAQARLDIPWPLITQSHRHGWTYHDLWLPSRTGTAGHTMTFDYPVAQTRLDIPIPLITQSHRHGWTYHDLWLPSHTDTAGHTKAFDYPVAQTRLDIPWPLITQSWTTGGESQSAPAQGRFETLTYWVIGLHEFINKSWRSVQVKHPYLLKTPSLTKKHLTVSAWLNKSSRGHHINL